MVAPGEPASASVDGWFCLRPERPWFGLLPQGVFDSTAKGVEAPFEVAGDMRAQGASAAFRKNLQIATRLRRLDHAKSVGMTRHWQVFGVVAGDLQENAAVRPTFVGLSGRMLEARAEADAGRRLGPVSDHAAEALHHFDVVGAAIDVSQQRCV